MNGAGMGAGNCRQITASANLQNTQGRIIGIFVSTSTAGTITVYDDSATGTTRKIVDTFSVSAGTWYSLPFCYINGLYIVISGIVSATVAYK